MLAMARVEGEAQRAEAGGHTALAAMERLGFAARGVMFLLIGGFAIAAAVGSGAKPHGISGALHAIENTPLRLAAATLLAIGLACFAGYFTVVGLRNLARARGARLWLLAAGRLGDAAIYVAVVVAVIGNAFSGGGEGERQTQGWTAWVLAQPFGAALVGLAGAVVLACGIGLIVWAATGDVDRQVELPAGEKRALQPIGRVGEGGRGLAIALVGVYWLLAGIEADASKAHQLGGALQDLRDSAYGGALLLALGIAFVASAAFELVEALFRRPEPD